ncbi:fimbrial protein [Cronobacter muytjensii]|uniref:fimbrial protein n=1 Tax=Cronobacter muytjensii TaxID=413501 RepID=UPI0034D64EA8
MKKTILGLAISTLFMVGAAQATINPNDVSATLAVTGSVTATESTCSVTLSDASVNLTEDISTMVEAGQKPNTLKGVNLSVSGDNSCTDMLAQGKLGYKFIGTPDNVDGTTLANSASQETAAKGVGIGIYNMTGEAMSINEDTVTATTSAYTLQLGLVKLAGQVPTVGAVQGSLTVQIERL